MSDRSRDSQESFDPWTADVVVIGGGVVGASVALHLTGVGAATTLVDRGATGQATRAAAGILSPGERFDGPASTLELLGSANAYYGELLSQLEGVGGAAAIGYAQCGVLDLVTSAGAAAPDDLETILADAQRRRAAGFGHIGEVAILTPAEVKDVCPIAADTRPGLLFPAAARVDGAALRDALLAVAEARGLRRVRGRASIEQGPGGWHVHVDGRQIASPAVVIAAGAWSAKVAATVGALVPVVPQRGQALELAGEGLGAMPSLTDAGGYVAGLQGGRFVAGATHEDAGFAFARTLGALQELAGHALSLAPGLQGARLRRVRVGFRPVTPDSAPLVGELAGQRGLYIATGTGAYGLQLGPYIGRLMAQLVGGHTPEHDLAPFSPQRFET